MKTIKDAIHSCDAMYYYVRVKEAKDDMETAIQTIESAKKLKGMTNEKFSKLLDDKIKSIDRILDEVYEDYQELKRYGSECKKAINKNYF